MPVREPGEYLPHRRDQSVGAVVERNVQAGDRRCTVAEDEVHREPHVVHQQIVDPIERGGAREARGHAARGQERIPEAPPCLVLGAEARHVGSVGARCRVRVAVSLRREEAFHQGQRAVLDGPRDPLRCERRELSFDPVRGAIRRNRPAAEGQRGRHARACAEACDHQEGGSQDRFESPHEVPLSRAATIRVASLRSRRVSVSPL
jgi:hypothetical protein